MLAVSSGRRQIAGRPAARHLEQLGHDPRAALALVELGELEDRRPHRLVARPAELVEQQPFELGQPGEVAGQPVARAAHQARSAARRPGAGSRLGLRRSGAHDPILPAR